MRQPPPQALGLDGQPESASTPESLVGQRVDVPSLNDQLAAYEARISLDQSLDDLDPHTAQWVGLLVAVVLGTLGALGVAGVVGALVWMW